MSTAVKIDNKEELYELYVNQQWSIGRLSGHYQCEKMTVKRALDRYGIPRRAQPEPIAIPADDLRRVYIDERKTLKQCAEHFGCSTTKVSRALDQHEIPRREPEWWRTCDD